MKLRLLPLLAVLLSAACSSPIIKPGDGAQTGFALGTTYTLKVVGADTAGIVAAVESLLDEVENSMSVYRPGSLLSRINRGETDSLDRHITHCLETALRISEISGGAYDVTVLPLTRAWGFADSAGVAGGGPPDIAQIMQYVGYDKIRIEDGRLVKSDPRVEIDLNSIAKGYACDLVGELLDSRGAENYLIEIGGEVFCRGVNDRGEKWRVGIDSPSDGNMVAGENIAAVVRVSGKGLATSGNYRRYRIDSAGRKVVHTLDTRTGMARPPDTLSATVVADNCALADGLATMFMAVGFDRAREIASSMHELSGVHFMAGGPGNKFAIFANGKNPVMFEDI